MNGSRLPVVDLVFEAGPDDRVFDWLLLSGPVVVLLIVVLGRSAPTTALAGGYLAAVVCYVLYRAIEG
jgi:hypothetical protein